MKILNSPENSQVEELEKVNDPSRRRFFQLAGGFAGAGLLLAACQQRTPATDQNLGTGDTALLNFLYILEQMEADFYTKAVTAQYLGISSNEYVALIDVRNQEIGHKEYLQALLGKDAITGLVTNFSVVNFSDRTSVLTHAGILEDMVIAGFNGAAGLFTNGSYPLSFSKLVSVEGRHAAYFRDSLAHNNFSDATVVDANGLNQSLPPATVLASALQYLTSRFDSTNLPN